MTRTRALVVAFIASATFILGASPASATSTARCVSLYWAATRSGPSIDDALKNAARAVWTNRYGNFGGWAITGVYWKGGVNYQVNGYRPGTSLQVVASCTA